MKKYDELFNQLFLNVFKLERLVKLNTAVAVLVALLIMPIIFLQIVVSAVFKFLLYLNVLLAIPSEYFQTLFDQSNKIASAPLFVVYFVAYPFKFFVDATISLNLIFMSVVFTIFQAVNYLLTFGQSKPQLYLTYATQNSLKTDKKTASNWLQIVSLVLMIVLLLAIIIINILILVGSAWGIIEISIIWLIGSLLYTIPSIFMFNADMKPSPKSTKTQTA